ncbi:MAG: phosphopantothenoylcysteine decarboxylase [Planctomycetales bacterium]|nr:phosphopantothenoylcysteine decarboxylase [Planctomycetales bacterium]
MTSKRIVVGIGGGIAAYKSATLVSRLIQQGHQVSAVLTSGASHFIGEATLLALCGRPPVSNTYDPRFPLGAHIELAESADALIIAPATARILASCAQGLADDLLATLYLAVECPVLMAPAMSSSMWAKPAVERNVDMLKRDGVHFVGPAEGWLSCRKVGIGRMAEPEDIFEALTGIL